MIYIIISNIGMALMMIVLYVRYSHHKISSSKEINELRKKNDKEVAERQSLEEKLLSSTKTDSDKIEALLREVDGLRKEKEGEARLRLEAEKQIELALQRTEEIQKRMQEWRIIQDAVMKDSKDAILKVGNDLYKKLNDSYKVEVETNKNLIGRVSKNISDFFEKMSAGKLEVAHAPGATADKKSETHVAAKAESHHAVTGDAVAKKLISDLVNTMKAGGHLVNKDYFLPANFDDQKAKLLLCEVAFVNLETLYIIDFKVCRYLEEYKHLKTQDRIAAENNLRQKLDKYFSYLSNPKYRESILKVLATTRAKFEKSQIVIVVPTKLELQVLKEIRYYEKARRAELEVMDFDGINNLVL